MVATLNEIKSGVWNQTNMAPFLLVLTRCGENADPIINAASPILLICLVCKISSVKRTDQV